MREAPSQVVIRELARRGAAVRAYDPVATAEAKRLLGDTARLEFAASAMAALHGAGRAGHRPPNGKSFAASTSTP